MGRLSRLELEVLLAIDVLGSIGAVARSMGLSQPTVSAMVAKLERNIGVVLVARSPSGSALTAEGMQILAVGRPVIESWAGVDEVVERLSGLRRALHVAASLTIAEYLVPRWLRLLPPEVRDDIEVAVCNSQTVMDRIEARSVNLGFVEGSGVRPAMRSVKIGEDTLQVVVAATHRWAKRTRPISLEQFLDSELALREPGSGTREVLVDALRNMGHETPAHSTTLGSTSAIKNWVKEGNGVAIISGLAVEEELASGVLRPVAVRDLDLRRVLQAVLPTGDVDHRARLLLQAATGNPRVRGVSS